VITRETDYALRLLRTLRDGERRTAAEAAERELVPQSFAHKILKKLARAGFVEVARGAEGGCRLSAELNRVTLYDLMTAMGEDSRLSSCMDPTYSCPWRGRHGGGDGACVRSMRAHAWAMYGSLPSDRHSGKAECGTEGPHFGGHSGSGRLIFSPTNWTNFIHF